MTRKWFNFQCFMESFLRKIYSRIQRFIYRWKLHHRLLILLLLGIFIAVGMPSALSQVSINNAGFKQISTAQQLMEDARNDYNRLHYDQAKEKLEQAVKILKSRKDQQVNYGINYAIALSDLALIYQKSGELEKAAKNWEIAEATYQELSKNNKNKAILNGLISSRINQLQVLKALGKSSSAEKKLKQIENPPEDYLSAEVLRISGNVLRSLGFLKESEHILIKALAAKNATENDINATNLSLGNTFLAEGDLERNRQANTNYEYMPWRCEKNVEPLKKEAKDSYQKAINYYNDSKSLKSNLNLLRLYIQLVGTDMDTIEPENINQVNKVNTLFSRKANDLVSKINLDSLTASQVKVYAQVNFAKSLACLEQKQSDSYQIKQKGLIIEELKTAIKYAEELKDEELKRAKSYAVGNLAGLYEYLAILDQSNNTQSQNKWHQQAEILTKEALYLAQSEEMPDLAYQWQWQLGRLLKAEGQNEKAIKEYEKAVTTLESVRGDLLTFNPDVQFNFRDNIEPIYRELISLLLPVGETPLLENIQKSLYYTESIQLAELENFLRCNLEGLNTVTTKLTKVANNQNQNNPIVKLSNSIDEIIQEDPTSAFIFPIILKEQLVVIFKVRSHKKDTPNQSNLIETHYHSTQIDVKNLQEILQKAYDNVREPAGTSFNDDDKKPLQDLYNFIIQPFESELKNNGVKTLRFVLDGLLRNIPMISLYDDRSDEFVVQKQYATAIFPTIKLLKSNFANSEKLKVLIAGSTQSHKDDNDNSKFPSLETIFEDQVKSLKEKLTNFKSIELTKNNLENTLKSSSYNVIHLITHGQFSSDPANTFIWTDPNNKINISEFGDLIQSQDYNKPTSLNLLILSSCQTAKSDKRAVLGIAGIAVKAGVPTIAPLWSVSSDTTKSIFDEFYGALVKKNINKAEALHIAQQHILSKYPQYSRPVNWAGFVLVGD